MMTVAEKRMKIVGIPGFLCMLVALICLMVSLIQPQESIAEKKKVTGTAKRFPRLALTRIPMPKTPIKGNLNVRHSVFNSTDPDWDNARYFFIQYNVTPDNMKGFGVITHPNGDQTFLEYESKLTSASSGASVWAGETSGFFLKGTGKFENIKARWKSKWTWNRSGGEWTDDWEVEYF